MRAAPKPPLNALKGTPPTPTKHRGTLQEDMTMSNESYTEPHPMNIPQEPRALDQWVIRDEQKRPINPATGKLASPTDPTTWSSFTTAAATGRPLGFVFTEDDPYIGIDLDHCRDPETGTIAPEAMAIIDRFATYAEISPSGTGIHLIGRGVKPADNCTRTFGWGKIECYDAGRYFTMTGRTLAGHDTIRNCQRELTAWHREVWPAEAKRAAPGIPTAGAVADRDLIARLERDPKAGPLLAGNMAGYPSPSEARGALAYKAIFYGADDPEQIVSTILSAGLFRDGTPERERERKARRDAEGALTRYSGERYNPDYRRGAAPPRPEPMAATSDPQDITGDTCADVRAELDQARETIKQLHRDKSMLMALLLNPYVTSAEKTAVAATLDKSTRKRPGEDGFVVLKPGEIANDWRPRAKPGENTDPLNRDGSKPWMSRSAVKRTMSDLTERKFIEAKPDKRPVEPKGREPYTETVWLVKPPTSAADFLAPIALFQPADVTTRKPRTITPQCADCGVDLISVTTWTVTEGTCPKCGQVHTEASKPRTVTPIVSIDPDVCAGGHVDKRSTVRSVGTSTVDKRSTWPAPRLDDEPPDYWMPPNWEDNHRRIYGQLSRGEPAS